MHAYEHTQPSRFVRTLAKQSLPALFIVCSYHSNMAAERQLVERIGAAEQGLIAFQERLDHVSSTMVTLGDDVVQQRTTLRNLQGQTGRAVEEVNAQFDVHQAALIQVVEHARNEFQSMRNELASLYGGTAQTFQQFQDKVNDMAKELADMKAQGPTGGGGKKTHGFLPLKEQVPKTFGQKEGEWRTWQDDVATYLDTIEEGMRGALKDAETATAEIDDAWLVGQTTKHSAAVMNKSRELHRALKTLTDGEARMVVQGVKDERGFEAWRLLHMRFGLSTAAKQGQVVADVLAFVQKPSRSPAETRARVTELERRVRVAEDVTGKPLDDGTVKGVLAMVLDPITRAHTTAYMGANFGYQELKRAVLEFVANNAIAAGTQKANEPLPMDIGRLGEADVGATEANSSEPQEWEDGGDLSAVGPGTQCFNCKGYGHVSTQCPSAKAKGKGVSPGAAKGKGKSQFGKGQSKGSPKGKGRGPIKGSCWTCGGPHFAQDCPKGSKGHQKGAYSFEEWPTPDQLGVRCLSSLTSVNRYAALADEEASGGEMIEVHNSFVDAENRGGSSKCSGSDRKGTIVVQDQPQKPDMEKVTPGHVLEPRNVSGCQAGCRSCSSGADRAKFRYTSARWADANDPIAR